MLEQATDELTAIPIVADQENVADIQHLPEEVKQRYGTILLIMLNNLIWSKRTEITCSLFRYVIVNRSGIAR